MQFENLGQLLICKKQSPVLCLIDGLLPTLKWQVFECWLLLQYFGIYIKCILQDHRGKGGEASQELLGAGGKVAVGVVDTTQDALFFLLAIASWIDAHITTLQCREHVLWGPMSQICQHDFQGQRKPIQ